MTDPSTHRFPSSPNFPATFIPPHGGYENRLSFQKATIVFDGTVWFCGRYLEKRDRTAFVTSVPFVPCASCYGESGNATALESDIFPGFTKSASNRM
jgi:hypothetical protein